MKEYFSLLSDLSQLTLSTHIYNKCKNCDEKHFNFWNVFSILLCFYREKLYKLREFALIIKPREKGEPPSANIYTDL